MDRRHIVVDSKRLQYLAAPLTAGSCKPENHHRRKGRHIVSNITKILVQPQRDLKTGMKTHIQLS